MALSIRTAPAADGQVEVTSLASGCELERLDDARAFFAQPGRSVTGTERELAKVADQVQDCVRLREREGRAVASHLASSR